MNNPTARQKLGKLMLKFPMPLVVVAVFVMLGRFFHIWHPLWLIFFLIPIHYHYAAACLAKTRKSYLLRLPVPETVVLLYLTGGFFFHLWGTAWWLFLMIPIYYWIVGAYVKEGQKYEE